MRAYSNCYIFTDFPAWLDLYRHKKYNGYKPCDHFRQKVVLIYRTIFYRAYIKNDISPRKEKIMHTDEEIISRYFSRDEGAIAATSQKYGRQCYSVSFNILRVQEDAEECVNETYLKVWNAIPPERPTI